MFGFKKANETNNYSIQLPTIDQVTQGCYALSLHIFGN